MTEREVGANATTVHVAGVFEENVQRCMRCGEVLCDYRNTMYLTESGAPKGYRHGEHVAVTASGLQSYSIPSGQPFAPHETLCRWRPLFQPCAEPHGGCAKPHWHAYKGETDEPFDLMNPPTDGEPPVGG